MSNSYHGTRVFERKLIRMAGKKFGKARPSGEPSSSTERKIRILLELIRNKFVTVSRLCEEYGTSERSLLRDFQELRVIGEHAGFKLNDKVEHDRMRMVNFDSRPTALDKSGRALHTLIQDAAQAFGPPVEDQLETLAGEPPAERRFLHFLQPRLREGSRVGEVFRHLEAAWSNNARVSFNYSKKLRCVEPACVLFRSGRYYLVAREPKNREWKYFALDKIELPIKRAGSFTPQPIPERYTNNDVIGFQQGGGEHRVTVWLSPAIAPSATSRVWQHQQEIEIHDDGSATIAFTVSDIGEVIRWALGFGADARISGPEHAIAQARTLATDIARGYAEP